MLPITMDLRLMGEMISHQRRKLRISQGVLAAESGVARATLADLERGKGNPTLETLASLCDRLGLEIGALFPGLKTAIRGPAEVHEAIEILAHFEALDPGLKIVVLTLIFDDVEYLNAFQDPGQRRKALRKIDELKQFSAEQG